MATCRDVITDAMRQAGIIPLSETPEAAEAEHGLMLLQSYYDSLFGGGLLTPSSTVYETSDYEAQENERVVSISGTVTLPDAYPDYDNGGERAPYDMSVIVVTSAGQSNNFVYSGGAWQPASELTLGSDAPLSNLDRAGLAAAVAEFMSGAFGNDVALNTQRMSRRFHSKLILRNPEREKVWF